MRVVPVKELVSLIAFLCFVLTVIPGCWIPLPEETAIVLEVLDAQGRPVDDVEFLLDGSQTIVTGAQLNEGQAFVSLGSEGDHTVQLDTSTLLDPQGGIGWMPLAYQISGDISALAFTNKPFVGSSDVLIVPVNKGEITKMTFYLDDILNSPADNQWLTDGSNPSPYRPDDDVDEFMDNPEPVFWWRQDPSLGDTVNYIFQLWEDDDGDTRYPLGITDHDQYDTAMDEEDPGYLQPDWQIPLAGIQRVEPGDAGQVILWSSPASDASNTIDYDLYYAPTSQWNVGNWESKPVLRDINPDGVDGAAIKFMAGTGTLNTGVTLKNGVDYTFALRARDGVSNLDTITGVTSTRRGTPPDQSASFGAVTFLSAVADSTVGGSIGLTFDCTSPDNLRIYAAPSTDFNARPFDIRFIRDTISCGPGSPNAYSLTNLVNGVTYSVGIEPYDASGNVGSASSVLSASPSSASAADTTAPSLPVLTVTPAGSGNVDLTVSAVADAAFHRIYWAPASFTFNEEAMMFTDRPAVVETTVSLSDIPNGVPFNYVVRAIDSYGNSSMASSQVELSEGGDTTGPVWNSDDPDFFATLNYSTASTVWPLGATWSYSGFALGQDPSQGQGEYVWRVVQEGSNGVPVATKLGAFYTYSGYYYASTESGSLSMSSPSDNADHRAVFSFVENAILSADVMGAPFDSNDPDGYRQRTASLYSANLGTGSGDVNQISILYPTDAEGEASISQILSNGNIVAFIDVFLQNKQSIVTPSPPHQQGKTLQLAFETPPGDQFISPFPFSSEGVLYFDSLSDPDYMDPLW